MIEPQARSVAEPLRRTGAFENDLGSSESVRCPMQFVLYGSEAQLCSLARGTAVDAGPGCPAAPVSQFSVRLVGKRNLQSSQRRAQ